MSEEKRQEAIKYAVHPGYIISFFDGDRHFVGVNQLIALYKLDPALCICWDRNRPETFRGRVWSDYVHIYPKQNGKYNIKVKALKTLSGSS